MKVYIFAALFGLFLTYFGVFAGLQISPILGHILAFPFVIFAFITGTGFGTFHGSVLFGLFLFTSLFWASIFILIMKLKTILFTTNNI